MKGPVRLRLATVLAAAVLASEIAIAGSAAADDTEPQITSWMLPPSTRHVWGILDFERARGSGPGWEQADSPLATGMAIGTASGMNMASPWPATTRRKAPAILSAATAKV